MKQPIIKDNRTVLCAVALLAVLTRGLLLFSLRQSPLRYYCRVPGLDMKTMLDAAEWGNPDNVFPPFFTLYRVLCAGIWYLNGKSHIPELLYVIQMAGGCVLALLAAWCVLHLFRNRVYATAAGILTATYAPALLYECTTLQESVVTFCFFASFAALLWTKKCHWEWKSAIFAGILLGASAIGRPTALLWAVAAGAWSVWKGRPRRRSLWLISGIAAIWLGAGAFNYWTSNWPAPFFSSFYILNLGGSSSALSTSPAASTARTVTANAAEESPKLSAAELAENPYRDKFSGILRRLGNVAWKAAGRLPKLFLAHEIPDNVNYYFFRDRVPPLQFLPGPYPVVPLAACGMLLILFTGRMWKKEGLLLLPVFCVMLPLCAIQPLGRYRLLLYGFLAISACYPFYWALTGSAERKKKRMVAAGLLIAGMMCINPWPKPFLRSGDFVAWGTACEFMKNPPDNPVECFVEAYRASGGNEAAAVNVLVRTLPLRQWEIAEAVLADALQKPEKINPSLMNYYAGLLRLLQNRPAEAEAYFRKADVERIEKLRSKYYFFRGESIRLQRGMSAAEEDYREAEKWNPPEFVRRMLKKLRGNTCENKKSAI